MKRLALLAIVAIVGVACASDPAVDTGAVSSTVASLADGTAVEADLSVPSTSDLAQTTSDAPTTTVQTVQRDSGGVDGPVIYAAEPVDDIAEDAGSTGELRLVDGCLVQGDDPPYSVVLWRYGTAWQARPPAVVLDDGTRIEIGDSVGLGGGFHSDLGFWVQDVAALAALERCQENSDMLSGVFVVQHRGAELLSADGSIESGVADSTASLRSMSNCNTGGIEPAIDLLSSVDRWLPVESIDETEERVHQLVTNNKTTAVTLAVRGASPEVVRMHGSYLEAMDTKTGAVPVNVYVGVSHTFGQENGKDSTPWTIAVVAIGPDGYAFLGECGTEMLSEPVDFLLASGRMPPIEEIVTMDPSQLADFKQPPDS